MKHNTKITILIISMFLITQFIGLFVINHYSDIKVVDGKQINVSSPDLPYGMEPPEIQEEKDYNNVLISILIAFIIAISLFFVLTRFRSEIIMRIWFFVIIVIGLGIFLNIFLGKFDYGSLIALSIGAVIAYLKVFRRNIIIHNLTEFLIYPSIAAVFVPILNINTIIILLIIISFYDMWAVWKSGVMQKMAKFQMDKVKIFSGFFVPYLTKSQKKKLKKSRKSKNKDKKQTIRARVAILGGGDIIFPIIASGVMLRTLGLIPALIVIFGALAGLSYLLFVAKKQHFYPAMPFITTGIFIGIALSYIIF